VIICHVEAICNQILGYSQVSAVFLEIILSLDWH
jgi:hypothetical protein